MREIHVALLYPCDPLGTIIGGIESFIRGVIEAAPEHIKYTVIGATTDNLNRPVGIWSDCFYRDKEFKFFPLYEIKNPGIKPAIPATIQYELAALFRMPMLNVDIIESHRIEHLLFRAKKWPYNLFLHQNMAVLNSNDADIRWKIAPRLYRFLETRLLKKSGTVFCVREDAVNDYRLRFPSLSGKFHFQPTWMDAKIFKPISEDKKQYLRSDLLKELQLDTKLPTGIAVGRLDTQKNPFMMLEAINACKRQGMKFQLIWIGDGILKEQVLQQIKILEIENEVKLAGLKNSEQIAEYLQAADLFVMSSAYEGMPIAVLEALACGCPVASTPVGEVPRLIKNGNNGYLSEDVSVQALTVAIKKTLQKHEHLEGKPCLHVASNYINHKVLAPVFENYKKLAEC